MHREAIRFGTIHGRTVALFFFLLAFSNCASGVLRGAGKSVVRVHDAHLLVWDPRSLCDDRTPDHSGIPDDLIGLPADMELKLDHFYRILASDGLGKSRFKSLFRVH